MLGIGCSDFDFDSDSIFILVCVGNVMQMSDWWFSECMSSRLVCIGLHCIALVCNEYGCIGENLFVYEREDREASPLTKTTRPSEPD